MSDLTKQVIAYARYFKVWHNNQSLFPALQALDGVTEGEHITLPTGLKMDRKEIRVRVIEAALAIEVAAESHLGVVLAQRAGSRGRVQEFLAYLRGQSNTAYSRWGLPDTSFSTTIQLLRSGKGLARSYIGAGFFVRVVDLALAQTFLRIMGV